MKKFFLIPALVLAALWACTPQEQPGKDNGKTTEDGITLVSESTVSVPVDGDIVTVKFKSTADWTAASDANWLTISTASGKAGEDCTVKASATKNETNDVRIAKVTITAGKATAVVTVNQDQTNALNIAVTDYVVPAEGGEVAVKVSANVEYEAVIPEAVDWVTVKATKGMTDTEIVFVVNETHEYTDEYLETWTDESIVREAHITIKSGDLSSAIVIEQKTYTPYFDFTGDWAGIQWSFYSGTPTDIPQEGADIVIPVDTNIDWRCYFSVWDNDAAAMVDSWDVGWAHLSFDTEKSEIHLVIDANETYFPREQYLYSECFIDGVSDGNFGGLGKFVQPGLVATGAQATLAWTKIMDDAIVRGNNRLAYKTEGGDALLVSDGTSVHALSPADGTYWKAITWPGVTPTYICSDEAGHVIVADNLIGEVDNSTWEMISGGEYKMYWASNINELHEITLPNSLYGTLGGIRASGDIATKGAITGYAGGSNYWFGYDMAEYAAVPNYYGTQNSGPYAGVNGAAPTTAAAITLGADLHDGMLYRGYDGKESLYYRKDAYTPAWAVGDAYEAWTLVSDGGSGGNENQNNIDTIVYNGKKLVAYTQGFHFNYSSNAMIYILDLTDPAAPETLVTIPSEDYITADGNAWSGSNSADVMWHATDDALELYVVHSSMNQLAKFDITF